MMGTRGKLNGAEYDAFSKWARKMFHWKPGSLKLIKAKFWRKQRVQWRTEQR